jgi:hypothetical protein
MRAKNSTVIEKARAASPWAGLGRCAHCPCVKFEGSGYLCEYCGHHYDDHGTSAFQALEELLAQSVGPLDPTH